MHALMVLVIMLLATGPALAEDLYVGQSSAGADDGSSCANQKAATFFNTAGNWGVGAGKISAGDTVHLCGTITSTLLIQASGTAGNLITVYFEAGAKLSQTVSATACSSTDTSPCLLGSDGFDYFVIDGGANGIIEHTANGTGLANQVSTRGIQLISPSNVEVKNLTIRNIYQFSGSGLDANTAASYNIQVWDGTAVSIHNNTLNWGNHCIYHQLGGTSTANAVYSNTFTDCMWSIGYAHRTTGAGNDDSNAQIYNNDITFSSSYCVAGEPVPYHNDAIKVFTQTSTTITNLRIYNNYLHGQTCTVDQYHSSAIVLTANASPAQLTATLFNNVVIHTGYKFADAAYNFGAGNGQYAAYNNTYDSSGLNVDGAVGWRVETPATLTLKNNVSVGSPLGFFYAVIASASNLTADNNVYYNSSGQIAWQAGGASQTTIATWRTECSCDASSVVTNPILTADGHLSVGSSAIGLGSDLSGVGITALNSDRDGIARGASWDAGAYIGFFAASMSGSASFSGGVSIQ